MGKIYAWIYWISRGCIFWTRGVMRMIDSAFESWDFICFHGKILGNIWSTSVVQIRVEVSTWKSEKMRFLATFKSWDLCRFLQGRVLMFKNRKFEAFKCTLHVERPLRLMCSPLKNPQIFITFSLANLWNLNFEGVVYAMSYIY